MVLAVWTVAMTAGVRNQALMLAAGALDVHLAARLGAAWFHGRECPRVLGFEFVPVLRQEVSAEGIDNGGEPDHLICPQEIPKPSIRPLMRSMAWCLVWSVRWV